VKKGIRPGLASTGNTSTLGQFMNIIVQAWRQEPEDRPTIIAICKKLEKLV